MQLLNLVKKAFQNGMAGAPSSTAAILTLSALKVGAVVKVKYLNLKYPLLERCIQFGIIPGSSLQVLHRCYSNMIIRLDNMKLAINDEAAKSIVVLNDEC